MEVKRKLSEFLKRETVLTVAILLAIVSAVMIPPDREYAGYIDFRTLSILFCLMTVMAGLQKLGVFRNIAKRCCDIHRIPYSWQRYWYYCVSFSV